MSVIDIDKMTGDEWDLAVRFSADDTRLALATGGIASLVQAARNDGRLPLDNYLVTGVEKLRDGSWLLLLTAYGKLVQEKP